MKNKHTIEEILTDSRPALDASSRTRLWSEIEGKLSASRPVRSPFLYSSVRTKLTVPVVLGLLVLVSTGGITLAAESSRPGDLLFPLERAFESARLTVAFTPEKKDALMKEYSDERLEELREIIDEEIRLRKVDEQSANFAASTTLRTLSIEADVFTDMTTVKVELNDKKRTFMTDADTRNGITEAVLEQFPFLTKGQVESSLDIEHEDRKSRLKDRGDVELSGKGSARVGSAVTEALTFIDESEDDDEDTTIFLKELRKEIDGLTIEMDDDRIKEHGPKSRFEWNLDDREDEDVRGEEVKERRVEWKKNGARVRIEEKNGRVRIDLKEDDDDDERDDRRESDSDDLEDGQGEKDDADDERDDD